MMGRFELGKLAATPGAIEALADAGVSPLELFGRHAAEDWGEVCPADARENVRSIRNGWRILSAYTVAGDRFYVITEWDRSVTTLLLTSEY